MKLLFSACAIVLACATARESSMNQLLQMGEEAEGRATPKKVVKKDKKPVKMISKKTDTKVLKAKVAPKKVAKKMISKKADTKVLKAKVAPKKVVKKEKAGTKKVEKKVVKKVMIDPKKVKKVVKQKPAPKAVKKAAPKASASNGKITAEVTAGEKAKIAVLKKKAAVDETDAEKAARAVRDAKRVKAIHEQKFGESLKSQDNHKEWLNGERNQIKENAKVRAKRAAMVAKMFTMRADAAEKTRLVKEVHQVNLNKSIKTHEAAKKLLAAKEALLKIAKDKEAKALALLKAAEGRVTQAQKDKIKVIQDWNRKITVHMKNRDSAKNDLAKAHQESAAAKIAVDGFKIEVGKAKKVRDAKAVIEKTHRTEAARLRAIADKQKSEALRWNTIIKKSETTYADDELKDIKHGDCAKGIDCGPYDPNAATQVLIPK